MTFEYPGMDEGVEGVDTTTANHQRLFRLFIYLRVHHPLPCRPSPLQASRTSSSKNDCLNSCQYGRDVIYSHALSYPCTEDFSSYAYANLTTQELVPHGRAWKPPFAVTPHVIETNSAQVSRHRL